MSLLRGSRRMTAVQTTVSTNFFLENGAAYRMRRGSIFGRFIDATRAFLHAGLRFVVGWESVLVVMMLDDGCMVVIERL